METRIRVLLLASLLALCSGCASLHRLWPFHGKEAAAAATGPTEADQAAEATAVQAAIAPTVIEPEVERRKIKVPKIRSSDFELGGYYGEISIEDFGAAPVSGVRLDYHITEDFFLEANYGRSRAGKTSYETLAGNVQLLTDSERRYSYYNLSLGYAFLPGEVFLGKNRTYTSGLYLLGGFGSTNFAGDQKFTANFGAGFQVLPTRWLSLRLEAQDMVFRSDLLGVDRLKNNLTAHLGASVYF
jgi:outer membrane beta-barrel protein